MAELATILERESQSVDLLPGGFERLLRRRDRTQRNRRIATGVIAVVLAALAIGGAVRIFERSTVRLPTSITRKNVGDLEIAWQANLDGSASGLSLRRATGSTLTPAVFAPTVTGDTVLVTSENSRLSAFPTSCGIHEATCVPDWFADLGGPVSYPPTVSGGVAYVATEAGRLFAFSTACGTEGSACEPLWIGQIPDRASSSPVVADGAVFVTDHLRARVFAFPVGCASDGGRCAPLWRARAGPPFGTSGSTQPTRFVTEHSIYAPVVADGVVYVIGTTHQLYALDSATGTLIWVGATEWPYVGGTRFNEPVVVGHEVLVEAGATLYAFEVGCGTGGAECLPSWTGGTSDTFTMTQPVPANGVIFVGTATDSATGHLEAFPAGCRSDGGTCAPLWVAPTDGEVTTWYPVTDGDRVYVNSAIGGFTEAFPLSCAGDATACRPDWRAEPVPGQQGLSQLPLASDGLLFVANGNVLQAFDVLCGSNEATCAPLWSWTVPAGIVSTPIVVGGKLFVVTTAGELYALTPGGRS